jgi:hypothetical protein
MTSHRPPRARRTAIRPIVGTVGTVLCALLVGCGVPIPPEVPDTSAPRTTPADGEVDRLVPVDTRSQELVDALRALEGRIREARELLLAGDAAGDATDADAVEEHPAVGVLLGAPGGGEARGVLPAIEPDRGGTASDDLITALITLASDTGGERGRLVLELVRDPMLGDLGAWQRDPVGVITLLRTIAADEDATRDARALDTAVLELPGELTRALGYALVVASSADATLVAHATEQAAGRLGVVLIAIELAIERLEGGS